MKKNKNNKEIIKPIEFVECPIEFVEKPISFIAHQKDRDGNLHEIEVKNHLLAGTVLPMGISLEKFERVFNEINEMEMDKRKYSNEVSEKQISVDATKIIRGRSEVSEVTNYELKPLCKRIYKNRNGKIDYSLNEILVQILIKENFKISQEKFLIRCTEIDKLTKIIGKKFPTAIIYDKKEAGRIENDFREKTSSISEMICYTDAGWQNINGKYIYVHNGCKLQNSEIMTLLNLPSNQQYCKKDIVNTWRMSLDICTNYEVSAVLSVYSFLGVTYKLFEEAGFSPHFLLFLNGKTGSLKTTIAKILYIQLADEQYREFPRRIDSDTQTSFERALVLSGQDTVTLIDDYSPAKSLCKKNDLANNLESIIRMVGDGSTKSRSNINLEDCRGSGVKGVVVLTGELRGKGLSSNLRCLYCKIQRENVNLNVVSWFQNNKNAYTTLIQHFTYFLSNEWINIVSYIKERMESKRREAEKYLGERRLVDTLATLWIMAEILGEFLVRYCNMSEREVKTEITFMQRDMISVVVRSEMLSNEENPARVFMKAVGTMMENKKLHLAERRLQAVDLTVFDGFEDDNYFYLLPDNVYRKVISWLKMGGLYFNIDINQLGSILVDEGYAVPTPNGKNIKLNYSRIDVGEGRKVKFLKISKKVIQQLQETTGQDE